MNSRDHDDGFGPLLRGTVDAAGRLLEGHLKLAKLELVSGASKMARPASAVAFFAILVTLGYALLLLGVAAWLQPKLGWAAALLLFGSLHLLVGGVGTLLALRRLEGLQATPSTRTDLRPAESITTFSPAARERFSLEQYHGS